MCDHGRMRAYSEDLRKKIVVAIERGMSKAQAARIFDVSLSSVKRYSRTAKQGGSLEPRKSTGRPHKIGDKAEEAVNVSSLVGLVSLLSRERPS